MVGDRYGRVVVVAAAASEKPSRGRRWLCRCDCGTEWIVYGTHLRSGRVVSCGCYSREQAAERLRARSTVHGESKRTAEYRIWKSMRQRCNDHGSHAFARYGGRGIRVCERWSSYAAFLEDMGRRPSPQHSIDRKDNEGNYEPANCRWATRREQNQNRRSNRWIEAFGMRLCVADWERATGIDGFTITRRIDRYGQTPEEAMGGALPKAEVSR